MGRRFFSPNTFFTVNYSMQDDDRNLENDLLRCYVGKDFLKINFLCPTYLLKFKAKEDLHLMLRKS